MGSLEDQYLNAEGYEKAAMLQQCNELVAQARGLLPRVVARLRTNPPNGYWFKYAGNARIGWELHRDYEGDVDCLLPEDGIVVFGGSRSGSSRFPSDLGRQIDLNRPLRPNEVFQGTDYHLRTLIGYFEQILEIAQPTKTSARRRWWQRPPHPTR